MLELPAPQAGVLVEILKGDGIDGRGQRSDRGDRHRSAGDARRLRSRRRPPRSGRRAGARRCGRDGTAAPALPAARKMMAEQGIGPADVEGTGRGGRVTKGDVLAAVRRARATPAPRRAAAPGSAGRAPAPSRRPAATGQPPEQRVPMSRLRQRVAERLVQSQSTAAILTTFNEVNMQPVIDLRNRYKDRFEKEHGVKLGFMSFFVKAAVHALKKYPIVNASIDGTDIVYHGYFDIGIAVGSPRGLVVPILRDAIRCRSPRSSRRSPTSASARRTASSRSRT